MGGFEGADHVNAHGRPLDMVRDTGHLARLDDDYARIAALGLGAARESLGWRLCEPSPHRFDFSRARQVMRAARAHGVQVLWSFMHYGTPPDVSLLDDRLIDRFATFAREAAKVLGEQDDAPVYNLVNEIGFLAWAVSATNMMWPYRGDADAAGEPTRISGWEVKCRLVRAVLAAREAVLAVDPRARFLHVEPLVHLVPPRDRPELQPLADEVASYQWQVWDLIEGRLEPQLGGQPAALDLLGINHYHSGQWEVFTEKRLRWHEQVEHRDARRAPFHQLLQQAWTRYHRPMIVAETSHIGQGRAAWLHEHAGEVRRARALGVPVQGLCVYPVLDRGDWEQPPGAPTRWHRSGLFDAFGDTPALNPDVAAALHAWQAALPEPSPTPEGSAMPPALLVFSHLRWSFVYQRPQQLLTRLARDHRIVFVEEPLHDPDGPPRLQRITHGPNIEVLTLRTPVAAPGFDDDHLPTLAPLLAEHLKTEGLDDDFVAWFYTPMALPLIASLQPRAVVYDCMDELTAFDHAPPQLHRREAALLQLAALVFTGGPALYEAKRRLHPQVVCLPSAVEAEHYAPAALAGRPFEAAEAEALQAALPGPRLGWFGVIDERMDLALLRGLAAVRPDWQFVMVGPVCKVDPATLPRGPNLHWLGQQPYARLPHLAAGWEVCLMPFALNAATRHISPTKTLEYLAAEKPVVSTPVHDVVGLYGDVVEIADDVAGFVMAIERALGEDEEARALRRSAARAVVQRTSWDQAARTVAARLQRVLAEQAAPSPAALREWAGALVSSRLLAPLPPAAAPEAADPHEDDDATGLVQRLFDVLPRRAAGGSALGAAR
jgi:glycosyltransferase involved in cell wall biosynthesis